jgi:hypothetical protein
MKIELALLARGIDAKTAQQIVDAGWTLQRLKTAKATQLKKFGLTRVKIESIFSSRRPPIPKDTLTRVLFANRFQCCVCRAPNKPIILHHIVPWSVSHNHDEKNLAVLCLDDHAHAHSQSSLSQNLDSRSIKAFKKEWKACVRSLDSQAIVRASHLDYTGWNYFNHLRLFELATELGIRVRSFHSYRAAYAESLVDGRGRLFPRDKNLSYMYNDGHNLTLYAYVKDVMTAVIQRLTIFNASDYLDRATLLPLLAQGDYVFVQGAHVFRPPRKTKNRRGKGQITFGIRKAHGIRISFTFDRWEATSSSSWATWLSGRQVVGSLVQVKSIRRNDNFLDISCTVLGISYGLTELKAREYCPRYARHVVFDDSDGFASL